MGITTQRTSCPTLASPASWNRAISCVDSNAPACASRFSAMLRSPGRWLETASAKVFGFESAVRICHIRGHSRNAPGSKLQSGCAEFDSTCDDVYLVSLPVANAYESDAPYQASPVSSLQGELKSVMQPGTGESELELNGKRATNLLNEVQRRLDNANMRLQHTNLC